MAGIASRIVKSALLGLIASVVSGGVAFLLMLLYVRHEASRMSSGVGFVFGGVLPCLCVVTVAFCAVFIWGWAKNSH